MCVIIVLCSCLIKRCISKPTNESHTIYLLQISFFFKFFSKNCFFRNMKYHFQLLLISQILEAVLCLSQSDRVDWQMFDSSINPHLSMSNGTWMENGLSHPFTEATVGHTHTRHKNICTTLKCTNRMIRTEIAGHLQVSEIHKRDSLSL